MHILPGRDAGASAEDGTAPAISTRARELMELQRRMETTFATLSTVLGASAAEQPRRHQGKFTDLLSRGVLTEDQLAAATTEAGLTSADVASLLIDRYNVPKAEIGKSLSLFYRCPFVAYDPRHIITPELLQGLKVEYLRASGWVPFKRDACGLVWVVVDDPNDLAKLDSIERLFERTKLLVAVGLRADIDQFLGVSRGPRAADPLADILDDIKNDEDAEDAAEVDAGEACESESHIARLAGQIIINAWRERASDIHIEPSPTDDETIIRFRVDGVCGDYQRLPGAVRRRLVARLKIMAQLDIAERRIPQDGKILARVGDRDIELRVATIPTVGGNEDVVMRLLNTHEPKAIHQIGLTPRNLEQVRIAADKPYGLMLCVGPTGSGKTTTLHAILGHINTPARKIWTAEDPVEIVQKGLRQVQVRPTVGLTFARALRAFLRADPDVIMVGEMRDAETAGIGVEASLTGHLVLSTLHSNSAAEAVTRLLDLEVDAFNFADALLCVLGQRLVRSICLECRQPYRPSAEEFDELARSFGAAELAALNITNDESVELYRGKGCISCNFSGFRGRIAIHELLVASDAIKRLVIARAPISEIVDASKKEGMTTLVQDGVFKTLQGLTTFKQVKAVALK